MSTGWDGEPPWGGSPSQRLYRAGGTERALLFDLSGVQIAIDDFRNAYSALSSLREAAVDTLRMNRSFWQALERDARAAAIVCTVASLGLGRAPEVSATDEESGDGDAVNLGAGHLLQHRAGFDCPSLVPERGWGEFMCTVGRGVTGTSVLNREG